MTKYSTQEERAAARKRQHREEYARRKLAADAMGRPRRTHRGKDRVEPGKAEEAKRIQRMRQPTLTGQIMGDPLPGRSALDHVMHEQAR